MPASDPTNGVPTPTGTLQGVAAFSWDGAAWQPAGRAGPSVATPTGVLQGVAAFNGGPSWQPSGRAGPGVATPSGVLDGVAVYTWSGSAWTPPGGQPAPSTPSGALRGVAAFDWDGTAWQPAGQAGPDVATPYGVLQGVARFNWTGTAWAAVGAPSLSLDFMTPGTLDARITFTRASTATYFNSAGVMQTAASNVPRWDYDPVTHALKGLLIEEARTNLWLQSADASNAAWTKGGVGASAAPIVTGNQTAAPDGTTTAARVAYPVIAAGANGSVMYQAVTASASAYTFSVWLKGVVGGEQLYLFTTADTTLFYRQSVTLTTAWQRFTLTTPNLTAATWYFQIGVDLRDAGQASTPAQTIYVWGAQVEAGAFATSYIPVTAAAVTRSGDVCSMPVGTWYQASPYSLAFEIYALRPDGTAGGIGDNAVPANAAYFSGQYWFYGGGTAYNTANTPLTLNAVNKQCGTINNAAMLIKLCWNAQVGPPLAMTATPASGTVLAIGTSPWGVGGIQLDGHIRRIRYWPRVLSDAEMQSVTT